MRPFPSVPAAELLAAQAGFAVVESLNLWLLYRLNLRLLRCRRRPIFGGGVINIPELVFAGALH